MSASEKLKEKFLLSYSHNKDVFPPDEYVDARPLIRSLLQHPDPELFLRYDREALRKQKLVRVLGTASLWLGGLALIGTIAELVASALKAAAASGSASTWSPPLSLTIAVELMALIATALALGPWFAHMRSQWLTARFVVEEMRQWHFQQFLDGSLIALAVEDPKAFEQLRRERWSRFTAKLGTAEARLNSFANGAGDHHDISHPSRPMPQGPVAAQAHEAYQDLRIANQLSYFEYGRERSKARDEWSEAVARWTLFTAVLLSAAQLIVIVWLHNKPYAHTLSASIAGTALAGVVLSAVVRVYRAAYALPAERERYDTKWVQLLSLKAAFNEATTESARRDIMRAIELLEIEESREFFRQMRRASYLL